MSGRPSTSGGGSGGSSSNRRGHDDQDSNNSNSRDPPPRGSRMRTGYTGRAPAAGSSRGGKNVTGVSSNIPISIKPTYSTTNKGFRDSEGPHAHHRTFPRKGVVQSSTKDLRPVPITPTPPTPSPPTPSSDDAELDRHLELALERSMSLSLGNNMSGALMMIRNNPSTTSSTTSTLMDAQGLGLGGDSGDGNGTQVFVCEGFPPQWKTFLEDELLCDQNIQSNDGKIFKVHRCIMASGCPFFYEKFCKTSESDNLNNNEEGLTTPTVTPTLTLTSVNSPILQSLIDFCYTGEFEKSVDLCLTLLPIAKNFKTTPILQQACSYLIDNMTPPNAISIYNQTLPYFCPQLETKARNFILHNFREIIRTEEFLDLDPNQLKTLLKDDHLNARNEAMVFEALRGWVEHAPLKRRKNIQDLLTCVRFGLMSYGYFTNVVYNWRFVTEDESVKRALEGPSVLLTSIDSLNNAAEVDLNDPLCRPRIPHEVIFAVGGWSAGSPTAFIETYDIRADRWFLLDSSDSTPRAYHGLVALDQYIYMIGGFDGNDHFNTVKRYDPINQVWEEKACMIFPRCYVSCCVLNGFIYACGGFNGRTRMSSAEKYIAEDNQWELIAPMNRPRSDASAAALKGKVYIAGGFTGTEVLSSVEVYDPTENQWTYVQPMISTRSGVSLVAYRDCLYAVGGFNGFTRLATAEKFDPEDRTAWKPMPDMSSARSNFAAVCADELLIVIGGFNGATTIPYVECYDSKVNEWFDASHMNLNRSALSACVVSNLPNAKDYSYLHRIQELLGLSPS